MNLRYLPRLRSARPSSAPRFSSGPLKLSDRMQSLDSKGLIAPQRFLHRHLHGDWGELDESERRATSAALESGGIGLTLSSDATIGVGGYH
ncbi:O-methyl transferase family domain-containing protein [Pseudomonas fluorescens]|uniref:O-methyl transferase family domain-containing protein n=1 Tax=Pseudomonas fluorescens TaxID=294 RepID=A0A379IB60_PSEFL|nr:hypothetical protein C1890_29125 [Pseudomonas sp. DP16D-R1]SUD30018.1 O-methyl transferase family domain-containing protein [Pseudomonas fluorescens]